MESSIALLLVIPNIFADQEEVKNMIGVVNILAAAFFRGSVASGANLGGSVVEHLSICHFCRSIPTVRRSIFS